MADTPTIIEPARDYLGVVCHDCEGFVPVVGPLDPAQVPADQPMRVGARGKLQVECPQCKHHDSYTVDELSRRQVS